MKVLVVAGFLGSGKTTVILKLAQLAVKVGLKTVVIENEMGEIPVDTLRLHAVGIEVREMAAGCICCSLRGDLLKTIREVKQELNPDILLIEPSGAAGPDILTAALSGAVDDEDSAASLLLVDYRRWGNHDGSLGRVEVNPYLERSMVVADTVLINYPHTASLMQVNRFFLNISQHYQPKDLRCVDVCSLSAEEVLCAIAGIASEKPSASAGAFRDCCLTEPDKVQLSGGASTIMLGMLQAQNDFQDSTRVAGIGMEIKKSMKTELLRVSAEKGSRQAYSGRHTITGSTGAGISTGSGTNEVLSESWKMTIPWNSIPAELAVRQTAQTLCDSMTAEVELAAACLPDAAGHLKAVIAFSDAREIIAVNCPFPADNVSACIDGTIMQLPSTGSLTIVFNAVASGLTESELKRVSETIRSSLLHMMDELFLLCSACSF